ncbi:MAG: Peptidoglycan-binding LysM [Candidatus Amesbacteria bacterium GW2011_GWB1_47_19]|nr:MAG: Peptidoglycan-binding LysM [Candidatus Amesbacteria bacterium GW2011_GWA1_44_24]KKU30880.1 MAG: Peptidoglycan-binding LysM [Candidatus Amesbacteria bacterium GW2011_GWC1_46_24]KKU66569.1 MAG: Peptidoglycan-binding LysM [Candidatus Amesbacteria bacterium GW2011_GWB1_47_19]OGD05869.1 MAG: hypothetical protein A2379_02050 [Candidatus Amesbacteria bacterium RIFOXYB1_FULL_47_13]HBC73068.1 hypothetical protein [Candidatus Amesbacteria bacterium]
MKDWLKQFKLNEQNISIVLGGVVVVLVGVLLFNYFGSVNKANRETTSSAATENENKAVSLLPSRDQLPAEYQIQKGDTLWNISERVYGSGYKWVDIVNSNDSLKANPADLKEGTNILLPKLDTDVETAVKSETATPTEGLILTSPSPKPEIPAVVSPGQGTYVVVKGDSLWKIAEKTYGSGYNWVDIYRENTMKIKNPDIIWVGTELNLPQVSAKIATNQSIQSSYTVVKGDNLWQITAKMCGDGNSWNTIATANNLVNPRVIEPGLVLKIVCK